MRKDLLHRWGRPHVHRANRGKPRAPWMLDPDRADIYSVGADGVDDTALGIEASDDITNW